MWVVANPTMEKTSRCGPGGMTSKRSCPLADGAVPIRVEARNTCAPSRGNPVQDSRTQPIISTLRPAVGRGSNTALSMTTKATSVIPWAVLLWERVGDAFVAKISTVKCHAVWVELVSLCINDCWTAIQLDNRCLEPWPPSPRL